MTIGLALLLILGLALLIWLGVLLGQAADSRARDRAWQRIADARRINLKRIVELELQLAALIDVEQEQEVKTPKIEFERASGLEVNVRERLPNKSSSLDTWATALADVSGHGEVQLRSFKFPRWTTAAIGASSGLLALVGSIFFYVSPVFSTSSTAVVAVTLGLLGLIILVLSVFLAYQRFIGINEVRRQARSIVDNYHGDIENFPTQLIAVLEDQLDALIEGNEFRDADVYAKLLDGGYGSPVLSGRGRS